MKEVALPRELSEFQSQVAFVQKRGVNEYSSSCPSCGGEQHQDREWPDRMRWFVTGKDGMPKARGWCRKCGVICWPDQKQKAFMSEAELAQRREMFARAEKARLAEEESRRRRLAEFTTSELWVELNHRLTHEHRLWWDANGVPSDWVDFWQLGYTADKPYRHNDELLHSSAYSIPIFAPQFAIKNMQYRLLHPVPGAGRYRTEYKIPSFPFLSRPDMDLAGDEIFIVEGGKKAMCLSVLLDGAQVIGVPSMSDWGGAESMVTEYGKPCVMFDPDSMIRPENMPRAEDWEPWPVRLCKAIGHTARLIEVSQKPDDMIVYYGATAATFRSLAKNASPIH